MLVLKTVIYKSKLHDFQNCASLVIPSVLNNAALWLIQFTLVNADRFLKEQIKSNEDMRHFRNKSV